MILDQLSIVLEFHPGTVTFKILNKETSGGESTDCVLHIQRIATFHPKDEKWNINWEFGLHEDETIEVNSEKEAKAYIRKYATQYCRNDVVDSYNAKLTNGAPNPFSLI